MPGFPECPFVKKLLFGAFPDSGSHSLDRDEGGKCMQKVDKSHDSIMMQSSLSEKSVGDNMKTFTKPTTDVFVHLAHPVASLFFHQNND